MSVHFPALDHQSKLPKYQQFINSILHQIKCGELKEGDKLPSIIDSSLALDLSRDTIQRAYKELYTMGVITSVYRKGYFISSISQKHQQQRLLFISASSTSCNRAFYERFTKTLSKHKVESDFMICHNNINQLKNIIDKELGNYHVFVIEPQNLSKEAVKEVIGSRVLSNNIIVLDDNQEDLPDHVNIVSLMVKGRFYLLLKELTPLIKRYHKLHLVLPTTEYFPYTLINEFFDYCDLYGLAGGILEEINELERGHSYIVLDEETLLKILKIKEKNNYGLGKEVGVLTLFEKEYLTYVDKGISSCNWYNQQLSNSLVNLISNQSKVHLCCDAELQLRASL